MVSTFFGGRSTMDHLKTTHGFEGPEPWTTNTGISVSVEGLGCKKWVQVAVSLFFGGEFSGVTKTECGGESWADIDMVIFG